MQKKNIVCYQTFGKWSADYVENGKRFALHKACCNTKAKAYAIAAQCIDYLNKGVNGYGI